MKQLTKEDLEELIRAELSRVLDLAALQEDDDDARPMDDLLKPFRRLGRGVMHEEYFVIPRKALVELMKGAKHSPEGKAILATHLSEARKMSQQEAEAFCNQRGFRTYEHFLKAVSALSKAQKGKLGD